ncbi:MAG: ion channel [Gemmatimonadales bacterium]
MGVNEERDLGFGSVVADQEGHRLLNRDGSFNVRRSGLGLAGLSPYHGLITMSWPAFLGLLAVAYIGVNLLFGGLFLACGPGALSAAAGDPGMPAFGRAFFFSVETFATIGYGNIVPVGTTANALVVVESLIGLLGVALATGIIFARFSRPRANVRFSDHALIAPYRGGTAFEFRIVNERESQMIDVEAKVLLAHLVEHGGRKVRRFDELELERRRVAFFPLAWTVVHPIDDKSPFRGLSHRDLLDSDAEILVLLTGTDETFAQGVHARSSYRAGEIIWGARFAGMFDPTGADGMVSMDISRLDDVEPLPGVTDWPQPAATR